MCLVINLISYQMSWISSHNICTWNVSLQCAFFLFGLTLTTCLKVKIQTKCDRGNLRKIWDKRVHLRRVCGALWNQYEGLRREHAHAIRMMRATWAGDRLGVLRAHYTMPASVCGWASTNDRNILCGSGHKMAFFYAHITCSLIGSPGGG